MFLQSPQNNFTPEFLRPPSFPNVFEVVPKIFLPRRGMELYEDEVRKMDPTEVQSIYLGFFKQLCVFRNF